MDVVVGGNVASRRPIMAEVEVIDISDDERDVVTSQPVAVEIIDISDDERDVAPNEIMSTVAVEVIDISDDE
ncbi:hypothetical protein CPB85DRAFT_1354933 [Mucidula mucida]|nr:hypothetical protein CPB85DRAFT_1354933 [Mucidula mucida]